MLVPAIFEQLSRLREESDDVFFLVGIGIDQHRDAKLAGSAQSLLPRIAFRAGLGPAGRVDLDRRIVFLQNQQGFFELSPAGFRWQEIEFFGEIEMCQEVAIAGGGQVADFAPVSLPDCIDLLLVESLPGRCGMVYRESAEIMYSSNQVIKRMIIQLLKDFMPVFLEEIDFYPDAYRKIFVIKAFFPLEAFADIFIEVIQLDAPGKGVLAFVRMYNPVIAEAELAQTGGFCGQKHFFSGRGAIAPSRMIMVRGNEHDFF